MPIEEYLVRYAAPTLAACKVANLISLPSSISQPMDLSHCQSCLAFSGIEIQQLRERKGRRLIYIYRRSALDKLLADVRAFITHQGKDARLTGEWKVYNNEEDAQRTFSLYADCRNKLTTLFKQGFSLSELSVCG